MPGHLWRFPTADARSSLAKRFNLIDAQHMQDWEWEVADPNRVDEFVFAYKSTNLTDDERFTLMEIIIQSFEDLPEPLENNLRWQEVLEIIEKNITLHLCSVWYWSDVNCELDDEVWRVTPFLRPILVNCPFQITPAEHS